MCRKSWRSEGRCRWLQEVKGRSWQPQGSRRKLPEVQRKLLRSEGSRGGRGSRRGLQEVANGRSRPEGQRKSGKGRRSRRWKRRAEVGLRAEKVAQLSKKQVQVRGCCRSSAGSFTMPSWRAAGHTWWSRKMSGGRRNLPDAVGLPGGRRRVVHAVVKIGSRRGYRKSRAIGSRAEAALGWAEGRRKSAAGRVAWEAAGMTLAESHVMPGGRGVVDAPSGRGSWIWRAVEVAGSGRRSHVGQRKLVRGCEAGAGPEEAGGRAVGVVVKARGSRAEGQMKSAEVQRKMAGGEEAGRRRKLVSRAQGQREAEKRHSERSEEVAEVRSEDAGGHGDCLRGHMGFGLEHCMGCLAATRWRSGVSPVGRTVGSSKPGEPGPKSTVGRSLDPAGSYLRVVRKPLARSEMLASGQRKSPEAAQWLARKAAGSRAETVSYCCRSEAVYRRKRGSCRKFAGKDEEVVRKMGRSWLRGQAKLAGGRRKMT
ncbi:hypothetical protein FNV43_RR04216 [Rhamnella rubrinervis]|uniref:Uncharacterized protein n=1 Tax=Rhamnella rubrinervis TaxID=2594499 RepID=A0A8K0HJX0_9ROSA|nr:hypothetical protein FNV43_RR04216 [Rhamnella rubrinervis]